MLTALFARPGERAVPVEGEAEIARLFGEKAGCLWVDLETPTEEERGILSRLFAFHKLAIENCFARTNHPRVNDYGDYLFLVFHGVSAPLAEGRVGLQEIDIFLGVNFLVTHHEGPTVAIEALRGKCAEVPDSMRRGPDRLLAEILDHLADGFVGVMEGMDGKIDALEELLFQRASRRVLREIFSLKKDILRLRRVVNPQREALNRLARIEHKAISPEEGLFFRDVYDHLYRVSEMVESFRDTLTGALEVYLTAASHRTNEIMKVLTVFSIILMSLSFIAGVYGMNVKLPGGDFSHAFIVLISGMAGAAGILLVLFRKKRWI
jgi:magnesium transporter